MFTKWAAVAGTFAAGGVFIYNEYKAALRTASNLADIAELTADTLKDHQESIRSLDSRVTAIESTLQNGLITKDDFTRLTRAEFTNLTNPETPAPKKIEYTPADPSIGPEIPGWRPGREL